MSGGGDVGATLPMCHRHAVSVVWDAFGIVVIFSHCSLVTAWLNPWLGYHSTKLSNAYACKYNELPVTLHVEIKLLSHQCVPAVPAKA